MRVVGVVAMWPTGSYVITETTGRSHLRSGEAGWFNVTTGLGYAGRDFDSRVPLFVVPRMGCSEVMWRCGLQIALAQVRGQGYFLSSVTFPSQEVPGNILAIRIEMKTSRHSLKGERYRNTPAFLLTKQRDLQATHPTSPHHSEIFLYLSRQQRSPPLFRFAAGTNGNQWEPWRATVRQLREHVWSSEQAVSKDLDTDITLLCQSVQIRRRCQTACDEFCEGGRTARQKIRDRFDEGIKLVFGENARRHEREATPTPLRGTVAKWLFLILTSWAKREIFKMLEQDLERLVVKAPGIVELDRFFYSIISFLYKQLTSFDFSSL